VSSQSAEPPERGSLEADRFPKDLLAPSERDRLVQAMAAVCAERGYAEATVAEVVERAGASPKTFEKQFGSKEECALAAVNAIVAESISIASAAYSADTSEWESLLHGSRALLELWAAHPSMTAMGYIQARHAMPRGPSDPYASGIGVVASMIDRLRAYAPSEQGQAPESAARGALGGEEVLIRRELVAGRVERLPQLLPDIIYGVLVPFLGRREALRYAQMARELSKDGR
jgi:AcrR family transcriptional regulator